MDIQEAARVLKQFSDSSLGRRVAELELALDRSSASDLDSVLASRNVSTDTLRAAFVVKALAGQINVVVHALGIVLALPKILEPDEVLEYVSLGAGNTGRPFDLETDRRIAEFKFITWRGGAEAIRQNQLFKEFYLLAEADSRKRRELYVTGAFYPTKFLQSGRALSSVMSRNNKLWKEFRERHGDGFQVVRDYYFTRRSDVSLIDLDVLLPEVFRTPEAEAALEAPLGEELLEDGRVIGVSFERHEL